MARYTVVIAPGYSPRNKALLSRAEKKYADHKVILIEYDHWDDPSRQDHAPVLRRLVDHINQHDDVVVVAKSFGALLSLLAMRDHQARPLRALLMGVPVRGLAEAGFQFDQDEFGNTELVFIQNEHDPHGSHADVAALVGDRYPVVCIRGADHHDYEPPDIDASA